MFLRLSVSHSVHGRGGRAGQRGRAWQGVCMAGGHAWQGGMHGRGVHNGGGESMVNERAVRILLECILVLTDTHVFFNCDSNFFWGVLVLLKLCGAPKTLAQKVMFE